MATRRKFLIGAAATTTGLAGAVGSVTAQAQTFELELTEDGFVGRAPSSIEGETNPTLEVEAGNRYAIQWTNSYVPESSQSGTARHNLVIANSDDSVVRRGDYVFESGVTKTVQFQATGDLATYFCEEHMDEGGEFNVSGGATATPEPTATATPTESGGDGGNGGEETSGNGPGFGVGAAVTAVGAAAYGALRRSDE
ncbi:PGF-CTERM sorting domain-containing protein [Haloplanus halobius]|uniref:PGF-CTERM sorting domain-containing protein n=1 Tax=Haloplanus halobius TaxID=2934938 RepID=UPI00200BC8E9|nr:PGF-CTERM sorting domain-containing protein [Haloplanus sp. XH21]